MKKFEYQAVTLLEPYKDGRDHEVENFLNRQGEQGWEVVSCLCLGLADIGRPLDGWVRYIMKREVPQ